MKYNGQNGHLERAEIGKWCEEEISVWELGGVAQERYKKHLH